MTTVSATHREGREASVSTRRNPTWWKTNRAKWVGTISLAITFAGLLVWWFHFRPYITSDDARIAATMVRVAGQGSAGRIVKVNAFEGDAIAKGTVLVELDHRAAEAQLTKSKANSVLTEHDLRRAEQLAAQHGITPRDVDKARAAAEAARGDLQLAEVALENTYLKSPIDGVVVQKTAEEGNILEPGQASFTLADVKNAWVSANIEETSIGQISLGQKVAIHVDEGGELQGIVKEIRQATAAEFALIPSGNAAGNFTKLVQRIPIKVTLEAAAEKPLRVGQSVEIRIRVR